MANIYRCDICELLIELETVRVFHLSEIANGVPKFPGADICEDCIESTLKLVKEN